MLSKKVTDDGCNHTKILKCKSSDEETLALQGLIRHHKNAPETEHSRGIRLINDFIYFFLKK